MKRYIFRFALLVAACILCSAQTQQKPAADVTVIRAGHMLDVKTGRILNDVWVVIDGGKIVRADTGAVPAANIIELPNATLLPGLIDAHTHITSDPNFGYQEL